MFSLDEAIQHCIEVAEEQEQKCKVYSKIEYCENGSQGLCNQCIHSCKECASEHRQLAEWLTKLKAYESGEICFYCKHEDVNYLDEPCYSCKHLNGCGDYFELSEVKADGE